MLIELDERRMVISPVCHDCRHRDVDNQEACSAFPEGIPLQISSIP